MVGSAAALAVAVGIVVFFVWKSRRRRSKKSNGKSCITDNTDNTGSHEMYRGIRQLMVRAACVFI